MNEKIQKARKFAIERHGEQKYGEYPYVYHLDMVYEVVVSIALEEDYQMAAYLHDVLEDTDTSKEELESIFGVRVTELVFAVTGVGENRKEKKASMIKKLEAYPDGINLKMADRLANMEQSLKYPKMFKMYESELNEYKYLFEKGNKNLFEKIKSLSLPKQTLNFKR